MADSCHGSCASGNAEDPAYRRILWIVLIINASMFGVEAVTGWMAKSASLQGDSLDFLSDAANYGIALFVMTKALRWRATAALVKGVAMALFGLGVLGFVAYRAWVGDVPEAGLMGGVGLAALAANVTSALLLFRHRKGDANRQSVWICSRNDAIANVAVIGAAGLVAWLGQGWPDWAVGFGIAALSLSGGLTIIRQARRELDEH